MSLHVECGKASAPGGKVDPLEVGSSLIWSETLATAGVATALTAPGGTSGELTTVVFTLTAEIDMWVSIAAVPAPGSNPRRRMKAGSTRSFLAPPGVAVAWEAV